MDLRAFTGSHSDIASVHEKKVSQGRSRKIKELPKHEPGERFVSGPIPLKWLSIASTCGNRADAVAILIWYAARLQHANPVKLSPSILVELRVHVRTARRVLQRMAEVGLVDVEFKRGRSPLVTIRPLSSSGAL